MHLNITEVKLLSYGYHRALPCLIGLTHMPSSMQARSFSPLSFTDVSLSNGDGEFRTLELCCFLTSSYATFKIVLHAPWRVSQLIHCSKLIIYSGSHLLSHTVSSAVPSAAWVLTIVFGMGTGVSPQAHRHQKFSVINSARAAFPLVRFRFASPHESQGSYASIRLRGLP